MRSAAQIKRNQTRFNTSYGELHATFAPYEGENSLANLMNGSLDNLIDYRNAITKAIALKKRQIKLGNTLPVWAQPDEEDVPDVPQVPQEPQVQPEVPEVPDEPVCNTCNSCDDCLPDSPCGHGGKNGGCECHLCDTQGCLNDHTDDGDLCTECNEMWERKEREDEKKRKQALYKAWENKGCKFGKDYMDWAAKKNKKWKRLNPAPEYVRGNPSADTFDERFKAHQKKANAWAKKMTKHMDDYMAKQDKEHARLQKILDDLRKQTGKTEEEREEEEDKKWHEKWDKMWGRKKEREQAEERFKQYGTKDDDEFERKWHHRNEVKKSMLSPWDKAVNVFKLHGVTDFKTYPTIKKAYKKLALRFHPDKNNGNDTQFKKITEAYQVMMSHQ